MQRARKTGAIGALVFMPIVALSACREQAVTGLENSLVFARATHVEDSFFAVAQCMSDLGFEIRFGGPRVMVRHVSGTDTTLSFRTQQFQGWRLPETTFNQTTVDYAVLGGAEMFNIKRADDGTLHVRIHEGTLIFQSLTTGEKIVARHVIRVLPKQGTVENTWHCRAVG